MTMTIVIMAAKLSIYQNTTMRESDFRLYLVIKPVPTMYFAASLACA
jgi:hypothetical protein